MMTSASQWRCMCCPYKIQKIVKSNNNPKNNISIPRDWSVVDSGTHQQRIFSDIKLVRFNTVDDGGSTLVIKA